ncbi:MAG: MgtC/SapB family protein [Parvularculaceae bacterium]|nr:MgtC/SapB family protein [Parvularculaceae bacterium]
MPDLDQFQSLAIATAIGFLIGFEREWREAADAEGRFAGARTFALAGLAGGAAGLAPGDGLVVAAGLLGIFSLAGAAYWAKARAEPTTGATTEVAFAATYLLGALATGGAPALAGAGGVATAILLSLKPRVLAAARAFEPKELGAALRFLAIAVIVLPLLPDRGFGPYDAVNPRQIWYFVVLISGLSFAGYWLIKFFGAHGVLLTGVLGGLASSTATTLSLARLARAQAATPLGAAAGVVAANVVMLARVAAILFIAGRDVAAVIAPGLAAAAIAGVGAALLLSRRDQPPGGAIRLGNPMELKPAILFAALLTAITLASRSAVERFGAEGFYVLSALAGLADVDAVTLSAAAQADEAALTARAAGLGVLIAIGANMLLKGGMLTIIAGPRAGTPTLAAFAAMAGAGASAFHLQ